MKVSFFKKLNQAGFSHALIVPTLVVVAVGTIGAYVITKSKAAPLPTDTSTTSTHKASTTTTPISALTVIITQLYNGNQVSVTKTNVTVSGPISDAQARPIVFTVNGKKYFAYSQGTPLVFNTTPTETANAMAITLASSKVNNTSLVKAHIDKSGNLVDPDFVIVGYSTGGN